MKQIAVKNFQKETLSKKKRTFLNDTYTVSSVVSFKSYEIICSVLLKHKSVNKSCIDKLGYFELGRCSLYKTNTTKFWNSI